MKSLVLLPILGAVALMPARALGCGGCFGTPSSPTLVTGHRMAFAVSEARTVLWDQFEYEGEPEDFSWVLPVLPGAYVEVAEDAWLSALDTFTSTLVNAPTLNCAAQNFAGGDGDGSSGCGCGGVETTSPAGASAPATPGQGGVQPPVTVVRQETVGPYDTVVVRSTDPNALRVWLTDNGYVVPQEIEPVIDAYVNEGNDFLALRLSPGVGVRQMEPVRVITPGGDYLLPLRMVAAGVGSLVDIKLFLIAEQRYAMPDIAEVSVPLQNLTYDFRDGSHNYLALREQALAQNTGKSYIASYARQGAFTKTNAASMGGVQSYQAGSVAANTLGSLYFQQAAVDDGRSSLNCSQQLGLLTSTRLVVEGADAQGNLLDADFVCSEYSDLATAMVGMHPGSVWVTRMEMNLPSTALDADCIVEPAVTQSEITVVRQAQKAENAPCPLALNTRKHSLPGFSLASSFALVLLLRRRARPKH